MKKSQTIFKSLWNQFLLTRKSENSIFISLMDEIKLDCGSGEEWQKFIDELPGYREYWNLLSNEMETTLGKINVKYSLVA